MKCNKTDMHKQMLTVQQVNELIYNKYGMSKEDFHKKYPNFKHVEGVGTVSLKDDIKDGQTTYLPMWEVSACDMYAFADKCGKEAASRVLICIRNTGMMITDMLSITHKNQEL